MAVLGVATMVRNEADRFWRSALDAWTSFADAVIILDDGSTDATREIAEEYEDLVVFLEENGSRAAAAWGQEAPARQRLFMDACAFLRTSNDPDRYLLFLDADMVPLRDPRPLLAGVARGWSFPLYDLWGETASGRLLYRDDAYWQAHNHPRPWLIRVPSAQDWVWSARGIHCGHLPQNWPTEQCGITPQDFSLLHYGYFTPEIRREKYERYRSVREQLSVGEIRHAESILEPSPRLLPLPYEPMYPLRLLE